MFKNNQENKYSSTRGGMSEYNHKNILLRCLNVFKPMKLYEELQNAEDKTCVCMSKCGKT